MNPDSPLESALGKLSIADVWRMLRVPGEPPDHDKAVKSPFRDDSHPSFSIFARGRKWKDHATGKQGDAVDFLAEWKNISSSEACREFIRLAGIHVNGRSFRGYDDIKVPRLERKYDDIKSAARFKWPEFTKPTLAEVTAVAKLRGLSEEGIGLAAERGLLFSARFPQGPAWVVTDLRRLNAQARKYDGRHWGHVGNSKAWTLPGSLGGMPIGLHEAAPFRGILLVEGGPDMLAAFHLMWLRGKTDLGVVAILGAANKIPESELGIFRGKHVRIFPHRDDEGLKAEGRWWKQLQEAGATIDRFNFKGLVRVSGEPVSDLNDFCLVNFEAEKEAVEEIIQL